MRMYVDDSAGYFLQQIGPTFPNTTYTYTWIEYVLHTGLFGKAKRQLGGLGNATRNWAYLPEFLCPSSQVPHPSIYKVHPVVTDYVYNAFLGTAYSGFSAITPLPKESLVKRNVSRTILFQEDWKEYVLQGTPGRPTSDWRGRTISAGWDIASPNKEEQFTNIGIFGAHGKAMNVVFLDGHASPQQSMEVNKDNIFFNVWDEGNITVRTR